ncbi:unnamed protein product [Coregonus sp. 'balchen']|nr:unnamed protein product [Coregonus sp. 'balchen']
MADMNSGKQSESSCDSSAEHKKKVHQEENPQQGLKRLCPGSPSPAAPHPKSPHRHTPASTTTNTQMSETTEVQMEPALELCSGGEGQGRDPEGVCYNRGSIVEPQQNAKEILEEVNQGPTLSPCPPQHQPESISQSLPEEERLEKLMEASMRLAVEKLQDSLSTTPNASLESLQTQVEAVQKGWCCLAKDLRSEPPCQQPPTSTASDIAMQNTMEQTRKAIHRLQAESASWESLLDKHRSKAEELARRVEQGQEKGMDTQCKMVRELLSIQEQSQLLVKETSRRLAADGGFQDLPLTRSGIYWQDPYPLYQPTHHPPYHPSTSFLGLSQFSVRILPYLIFHGKKEKTNQTEFWLCTSRTKHTF